MFTSPSASPLQSPEIEAPVPLTGIQKALARGLRSNRSVISTEGRIQELVASILTEQNIKFDREHPFSRADRADFFLPQTGFVIEIKKASAGQADLRQIGRYLQHSECSGCLLIAMRISGIPSIFLGKPIERIDMWKLLL